METLKTPEVFNKNIHHKMSRNAFDVNATKYTDMDKDIVTVIKKI